jgi:hypothetical protein
MAYGGVHAEHAGLPEARRPFMSSLFRRQWQAERVPPTAAHPLSTPTEVCAPGCGWFDSSHELNRGLQVTEHVNLDAVAGDLPLSDWLRMQLAGWRAVEPGRA